ncbi:asparaginase [Arthrobacter sp. JSM 101049]|uniref:asparaginase n=1 Tax=Arthrobacter sp. JSM 101049 TaxID=929097 RepID=UPI00356AD487
MNLPSHAPLAVATRGDAVESIHYGSLVATSPDGSVLGSLGDATARFYPRSALKPLFAVGMLRAGLRVSPEQLALASASHNGSARHQEVAASTLAGAGLDDAALANSADLPYGPSERAAWLAAGHGPTRQAQNCSGKHAALLALCVQRGWPVEGYLDVGHPVNELLRTSVEDLAGEPVGATSTDGCGTPVYTITLAGLARAFALLASAAEGTAERQVADAMRAHPDLVAGEGRDVTAVMRAVPGLVAKDGFEGIQAIGLPDGTGLAVKISDGGDRARMPVAAAALSGRTLPAAAGSMLGDAALAAALHPLLSVPALGGGQRVGELSGVVH